nr:MAG TPA: hypothetical protein [Caudoviricetes sp.]
MLIFLENKSLRETGLGMKKLLFVEYLNRLKLLFYTPNHSFFLKL